MLRYTECQKKVIDLIDAFDDWRKIVIFLEFLNSEETISDKTYEIMMDSMMRMKMHVATVEEMREEKNKT